MPEDVTPRHRSGGAGRLLALRNATPRHAAAEAAPPAAELPRPRRWPWVLTVVAVFLLAATTPLILRNPRAPQVPAPLPSVSLPRLPTETDPAPAATTRRALQAVRQAAKVGAPPTSPSASASTTAPVDTPTTSAAATRVMLGPGSNAALLPLLDSYCRATYGQFTRAMSTPAGWFCGPFGRAPIALDMDAMCRWRYGDGATAVLGNADDPQSWRCYRAGP